jgi:hypothetical protein
MHARTLSAPILTLLLFAGAVTLPGCGRKNAQANGAPEGNPPVAYVPDTKPAPEVRWADATVPKGTPIRLSLIDLLTSRTSRKGDPFRALVTEAIVIDGTVTVPSGSNVLGVVRDVVSGETGFMGKGGMLALDFNRIDTPTGASAPVKARLTSLASRRTSTAFARGGPPGAVTAGAQGKEAVLEPNVPMTVVLEEPLHIRVKQ